MAALVVSGIALAAQSAPEKEPNEDVTSKGTTSEEVVFAGASGSRADSYKIHSWWYTRVARKYIPLRRGWDGGPGRGFGQRHIKGRRGWNDYIKGRLKVTLGKGRLEQRKGTRRRVEYTGGKGCTWRASYDLRKNKRRGGPDVFTYPFGVITLYDLNNDRDCP